MMGAEAEIASQTRMIVKGPQPNDYMMATMPMKKPTEPNAI